MIFYKITYESLCRNIFKCMYFLAELLDLSVFQKYLSCFNILNLNPDAFNLLLISILESLNILKLMFIL